MNDEEELNNLFDADVEASPYNPDSGGALSSIVDKATTDNTAGGLASVDPVSRLSMAKQRMEQLTELKKRMAAQAEARKAAMQQLATAYESNPYKGLVDPGLLALGSSVATNPSPMAGFIGGMQGMEDVKRKLAEREWARKASAQKIRAETEQQGMTDILNEGRLDQALTGGLGGRAAPHIREYTNEKGERVQSITDAYTGEVTQKVLGKTQGRAGELPKLKAGFQWAKNPDGTPQLDEKSLPVQAKITTLPTGTVPGSAASGDVPEKGWTFYTDGQVTFRGNPNAPNGGFQKQTKDGWAPTADVPTNLKKLGASAGPSALNQRFAGRVIGASNEGLAALSTIAGMGDPSTGAFGSKIPGNIFARTGTGILAPEQAKRYNATIAGLAVEIATAQNQGMVPNGEQIKHVEDAITIQPTDDETTKKYRVALAARYLDKALETSHDLASEEQRNTIKKIRTNLQEFPDPNGLLNLKPEEHMFKGEAAKSKDDNVLSTGPVYIYSDADYDSLPSGTVFVPPDGGKPRRKP